MGYAQIIGTLLIGIIFNTFLYGVVTFQYCKYYTTRRHDPLWLRVMIAYLFVQDTLYSASVVYMLYYYCVFNFGNPAALTKPLWPYPVTVIQWVISAFATQAVLSIRIYKLTKCRSLLLGLLFGGLVVFALGQFCGIKSVILTSQSGYKKLSSLSPFVSSWLATQTALDVVITSILVYHLSRSKTGFADTDMVINRLIRGAIQSGLFAGLFSMADLFAFLLRPHTNLYGMFAIPVARFYTMTLLGTLLVSEEEPTRKGNFSDSKNTNLSIKFRGRDQTGYEESVFGDNCSTAGPSTPTSATSAACTDAKIRDMFRGPDSKDVEAV